MDRRVPESGKAAKVARRMAGTRTRMFRPQENGERWHIARGRGRGLCHPLRRMQMMKKTQVTRGPNERRKEGRSDEALAGADGQFLGGRGIRNAGGNEGKGEVGEK